MSHGPSQMRPRKSAEARTRPAKAPGDALNGGPSPPKPQPRKHSANTRSKIPDSVREELENALVGLCDVWFEDIKPHLVQNNIKLHVNGAKESDGDGGLCNGHGRQSRQTNHVACGVDSPSSGTGLPSGAPGCPHVDPGAASDRVQRRTASSVDYSSTPPAVLRARSPRPRKSLPPSLPRLHLTQALQTLKCPKSRKSYTWRKIKPPPTTPLTAGSKISKNVDSKKTPNKMSLLQTKYIPIENDSCNQSPRSRMLESDPKTKNPKPWQRCARSTSPKLRSSLDPNNTNSLKTPSASIRETKMPNDTNQNAHKGPQHNIAARPTNVTGTGKFFSIMKMPSQHTKNEIKPVANSEQTKMRSKPELVIYNSASTQTYSKQPSARKLVTHSKRPTMSPVESVQGRRKLPLNNGLMPETSPTYNSSQKYASAEQTKKRSKPKLVTSKSASTQTYCKQPSTRKLPHKHTSKRSMKALVASMQGRQPPLTNNDLMPQTSPTCNSSQQDNQMDICGQNSCKRMMYNCVQRILQRSLIITDLGPVDKPSNTSSPKREITEAPQSSNELTTRNSSKKNVTETLPISASPATAIFITPAKKTKTLKRKASIKPVEPWR